MANPNAPLSYSAALSGGLRQPASQTSSRTQPPVQQGQSHGYQPSTTTHRRPVSPKPEHRPRTPPHSRDDDQVYVLTLQTNKALHAHMTQLRTQHFPRYLNKLDAHLTLFHALPSAKLEDSIIPHLQRIAEQTAPFTLQTTRPFRLKKGIAIGISKPDGETQAQVLHRALQAPWLEEGWLSEQDAQRGVRVHYTIMNKVDDEATVAKAMEEVKGSFKGEEGMAEGLGLWRYERGFWKWERGFAFAGGKVAGT